MLQTMFQVLHLLAPHRHEEDFGFLAFLVFKIPQREDVDGRLLDRMGRKLMA
jgi:hypothetical protein